MSKLPISIEQLREDTPGCQHVLHLNNAGAALPPLPVINAIKAHIDLEANMGGYEAANASIKESTRLYKAAAELINCSTDEIAFMENATRAWDMAFYSLQFNSGDRIITAKAEYVSNYLAFLHRAQQCGIVIDVIENDETGQLDIHDLKNKLTERHKLIAITHVPTQGGLINPAIEVGKIARTLNIPYLLDTTQSIGQMPIDVKMIQCDFLCATGRKYLRGPRGTGFLFVKKSIIEQCNPPFIDLHSALWTSDNEYILKKDATRFETWEQSIANKIGLAVAIDYALTLGMDCIWERVQYLATQLRQQLIEIPSVELQDLGQHLCGIVTFTCKDKSAEEIKAALSRRKINVSISLQEYARLDLRERGIASLVRASVHYYNTIEEVSHFCAALKSILI